LILVRLLPGVVRQNALDVLKSVHNDAVNLYASHGTAVDRLNGYLNWAVSSSQRLRTVVSADDLNRLVLTRRYWALQSLVSSAFGPVAELVSAELEERKAELEIAVHTLETQIERWSRPGVLVIPDTSFFIRHPAKLEEADFAGLLGLREAPIRVLVPIVIVDELDRLKEARGDSNVRWRAGYTVAVLDDRLKHPPGPAPLRPEDYTALSSGGMPRGEVGIEVLMDPPGHLRLPINDDEIVDRALAVQSMADQPVTIITYDTGQALRARTAGLRVHKLGTTLQDEPVEQSTRRPSRR